MSDALDTLVDAFVAKLAELGYSPNPGVSPVVLDYLESKNGWKFPDAMRRYLLKANGCANGMCRLVVNGGMWTFWPVDQWHDAYLELADPDLRMRGYLGFADAMMGSPIYGICLDCASPEFGRIKVFDGYQSKNFPNHIPSFEGFIRAWLAEESFQPFYDEAMTGVDPR